MSTEKEKMHNLKIETYVYLTDNLRTSSPGDQDSQILLRDCSEEVVGMAEGARINRSFCKNDHIIRTSKDYCSLKKTSHLMLIN